MTSSLHILAVARDARTCGRLAEAETLFAELVDWDVPERRKSPYYGIARSIERQGPRLRWMRWADLHEIRWSPQMIVPAEWTPPPAWFGYRNRPTATVADIAAEIASWRAAIPPPGVARSGVARVVGITQHTLTLDRAPRRASSYGLASGRALGGGTIRGVPADWIVIDDPEPRVRGSLGTYMPSSSFRSLVD